MAQWQPQGRIHGTDYSDGFTFLIDLDNTLTPTDDVYYLCGHHAALVIANAVAARNGGRAPATTSFNGPDGFLWRATNELRGQIGAYRDFWPLGVVMAYRAWCEDAGIEAADEIEKALKATAEEVYDPAVISAYGPLPGTKDALQFLAGRGSRLVLVTLGSEDVQIPKLEALGIDPRLFDEMHFEPRGKRERYEELADGADGRRTFVVGDSVDHDMAPFLERGFRGFLVRYAERDCFLQPHEPPPRSNCKVVRGLAGVAASYHRLQDETFWGTP